MTLLVCLGMGTLLLIYNARVFEKNPLHFMASCLLTMRINIKAFVMNVE